MKHTLIFFLLSLSLFGCSSNSKSNYLEPTQSALEVAKNAKMDKRHMTYLKGVAKYQKGNYSEAVKYFKKAALQGHIIAKNDLGSMYYGGKGVPQDYKKALFWFEQVIAQSPDDNANYNIAQMYRLGLGLKKDYRKAMANYQIAAKMGNNDAKNALGVMYERGLGVEINSKLARDYYIDAATEGSALGINNLGAFAYRDGDYNQARLWYEKAAAKGNKQALKNLADLDAKGL